MSEKRSRNIFVEAVPNLPMEEQPTELVERKGVGHPDSICDAIMDSVSVELCRAYICLLYTSPSPRDLSTSRMPSSA